MDVTVWSGSRIKKTSSAAAARGKEQERKKIMAKLGWMSLRKGKEN